jgi:plastocyanin
VPPAASAAATAAPATAGPATPTPAPTAAPASRAASAVPPAVTGTAVTIQNFAFSPPSLVVKVGATVKWTNRDAIGHTVTADDGSFGSSRIGNGVTFSQTFSKAGTFTYHCSIHKSMTGTVVVK